MVKNSSTIIGIGKNVKTLFVCTAAVAGGVVVLAIDGSGGHFEEQIPLSVV